MLFGYHIECHSKCIGHSDSEGPQEHWAVTLVAHDVEGHSRADNRHVNSCPYNLETRSCRRQGGHWRGGQCDGGDILYNFKLVEVEVAVLWVECG